MKFYVLNKFFIEDFLEHTVLDCPAVRAYGVQGYGLQLEDRTSDFVLDAFDIYSKQGPVSSIASFNMIPLDAKNIEFHEKITEP